MKIGYQLAQILFVILMQLSVAVVGAMLFISALFLPRDRLYAVVQLWPDFTLWVLKWLCKIDCEVEGLENLSDEPVIIFAKHESTWETLFLVANVPKIVFVAKQELIWVPIFGWGIKLLRYITIKRGNRRAAVEQMCEQARERLDEGLSIVVFPEGTRRPHGAEPKYKIGGAVMAERTGAKILPISHDAGRYWPRRPFKKNPGTIRVLIHPLIDPSGLSPQEISAKVESVIEAGQAQIDQAYAQANDSGA